MYRVWRFCGGWNPALVPAAAAYYGAEDTEALLDGLMVMRDRIEAHRDAQIQAQHARRP